MIGVSKSNRGFQKVMHASKGDRWCKGSHDGWPKGIIHDVPTAENEMACGDSIPVGILSSPFLGEVAKRLEGSRPLGLG